MTQHEVADSCEYLYKIKTAVNIWIYKKFQNKVFVTFNLILKREIICNDNFNGARIPLVWLVTGEANFNKFAFFYMGVKKEKHFSKPIMLNVIIMLSDVSY